MGLLLVPTVPIRHLTHNKSKTADLRRKPGLVLRFLAGSGLKRFNARAQDFHFTAF